VTAKAPALLAAAALALAAVATACPSGQGEGPPPPPSPTLDATALAAASGPPSTAAPSEETCVSVTVIDHTLDLSPDDFAQVDASMGRTIELAEQDDVNGATATFLHEVHSFTHVIDTSLRQRDGQLGERLFNAVIEMESGLVTGLDGATMAGQSTGIRALLREAGEALGCAG
jgi:hypothetical protein